MAQSFSLEDALGGASAPAAAPSRGFSLDEALGVSPKASIEDLGSPMGDDVGAAIMAEAKPKSERRVYTGSVFDTQPFEPEFNPEEAARLSRREYAEKGPAQPRRTQYMRATPENQTKRSAGRAALDTAIGVLQGANALPQSVSANILGGDNPVTEYFKSASEAGQRSKSPYLLSQQAERNALLKNVEENQGELAAARATFSTLFTPAGADVVAQGAGSMLPTVGMSILGLGIKALTATNALSVAGESAQSTAEALQKMSPQDWSNSQVYASLRESGLSHRDAVKMLAPLYAMPNQILGGIIGGASGLTGLESGLAGKAITGGALGRAKRATAELVGEEAETLIPGVGKNATLNLIDDKTSLFSGLGREAVETAFGSLPGSAIAAAGKAESGTPKELDTRGLADKMARERGFLVPEARTKRPAPAERPAPAQGRVEPTFDEGAFAPPAPKSEDDLTKQRAQEQSDVIELEGEGKPTFPERFTYMEEAAKYDTPEMRLKQAEALGGEDVTGLIFGETESYGRAALKKKSLTAGYAEKKDNRSDASDAATVAFGTGNYGVFAPYEKLFPRTAAKLKAALTPKQEVTAPETFTAPPDALESEIDKPFSIAEEMEGVPAPMLAEVEGEIGKLTKDQEAAFAERENLEKRTAGTSLMKVLQGSLKDREMSELGGKARKIGKNPFISLVAKKGTPGSSMEDMVDSGKLDQFLPFKLRPEHPEYVNSESAEYIRDKLRNNQFYTYETELAIQRVGQDIESLERQIQELLSDDDINKELQYAANEQREIDQAAQEPAAPVADGAAEQREAKAKSDELDKREAQLKREAELNEREAKLLEERKRLEEERLKLESPTKEDVADQEERKAKAAETDEREQIRKESEAGAGQFELKGEDGRQDTTGSLFDQPAPPPPAPVGISPEQERKTAVGQLKKSLLTAIPPFNARGGDGRVTVMKPTPLSRVLMDEVLKLVSNALDLGLPPAVLGKIKAAGSTRSNAIAMMTNNGWLMLAKQWKTTSQPEKLLGMIHEIGHAVDYSGGVISNGTSWNKAHSELENWYRSSSSADKFKHPVSYPFARQYQGKVRPKQESFAQAFGYYFTSPVDLQKNAPEAYSQIQAIIEGIQNESQAARAAGTTKTGTATVNVQPTRATQGAAVQSEAGQQRTDVSKTARLEDRGAGKVTDTPAFKRWFGDSKVVNESGEPLVMYHGTSQTQGGDAFTFFDTYASNYGLMGMGGYFTSNPDVASSYTTKGKGPSPTVYPVFLSIKNPLDMDAVADADKWMSQFDGIDQYHEGGKTNESWYRAAEDMLSDEQIPMYEGAEAIQDGLRNMGFDGITHIGGGRVKSDGVKHRVFIAFDPTQIKSATGNSGAFNPKIQDINAAIAGKNVLGQKPLANWTMPDATNLDKFIYSIQNKQIDMKRAVDAINEAVGQIDERFDPYMKETLFAGRTATQTKRFLQNELKPLFEEMGREKVTMPELEEYLQNRHAQERNEQIAKVNPGMPDKGSGIATADAQNYLANLTPEQETKYKKLAGMVDAISAGTRQLLVDSGLESQDTIDKWEETYDNYVPLNRDDIDYSSNHGMGVGQGYSVRGSASKRAVGSERKVVDILANIAMQRERNIVRAEKNRVAMALYGMAIQNPNPEFFLAVNPDAKKDIPAAIQELVNMGFLPSDIKGLMNEPSTMEIDPQTGLAIERIHQMQRGADNVMGLRVNGENRYVFFNQNNERANRMASAIKNLDADQLGAIMSTMANATRFLAAMNTQYNPIFGAYNFLRDISTAGLQLTKTPLAGKQAEVLSPKNVYGAMRGIYTDLRAERGGKAGTSQWSKLWEEFQQRGGQTGFRDQFSSTAKRGEALQRIIDPSSWADSGLGKVFTAGGALKVPAEVARKAAAPIFNWLSDYNETMENAIRLSAYKAGLDNGMSKDAAAVLAKELTVNFNRKGQVATQAGALYAFFNASVQGTTALAKTLSGPAGKKIIAGGLMLGGIQAVLYSMAGFDEGEPPEFIREKNFVMPIGNGKYLAIPLPLGYNVIPNTSRLLTEAAIRGIEGKKIKPTETVFKIFESLLGAFNPIGNAGWSFQTFAPTTADPIVALMENRDWTGKKIAREDFNSLDPTPGFTRYKESASTFSRTLAEFMNSMSGGTKDAPGKISPTPDQLDYFIGQITGGVGREALKIERTIRSSVTGEELPPHAIPLAGRFYGDTKGSSAVSNAFYENLKEMNIHENTIKGMRQRKENVQEYFRENPEARMFEEAGRVEREVQALRKRRRELVEKEAPKESVRAIEARITARMTRFNEKIKRREEQRK